MDRRDRVSPVCLHCGGRTRHLLRSRDYNRNIGDASFDYWRCRDCDLVFLDPMPADLARWYPEDYYGFPDSREAVQRGAEIHEAYKVDLVRRFASGGRLVEIGPATGGFALLAQAAGFDVSAIEMNARCAAFIRDVLGVRARHATDELAALAEEPTADVIALWQVIEHLRDPFRLIEMAASRLRPGGHLVLAAPDPASLQFRLFGRWWVHLDAPRHVILVPRPVLAQAAARAGLDVALETTTDPGSLYWNTFGWEYSMRNVLRGRLDDRRIDALARWAARKAAPRESREGGGGTCYTMVFRKR